MENKICQKSLPCGFCQKHKIKNSAVCQNCMGWIPTSLEHIEELWEKDTYFRERETPARAKFERQFLCEDSVQKLRENGNTNS